MNKSIRQIVLNKYKGNCAYCGTKLQSKWNIDHIKPKVEGGTDDIENLNPSCVYCNNYKGGNGIEHFRTLTKNLLNNHYEYLFRSKTKMMMGLNMGAIKFERWDGVFYFEKIKPQQ